MPPCPDLPDPEASRQLADWLSGPRGRLLRRAQIGARDRVLEIGPGHGFVTSELTRRARGTVVTIDHSVDARGAGIPACGRPEGPSTGCHPTSQCRPEGPNTRSKTEVSGPRPPALATLGDALSLPFASHSFDLIFCQNVLLWTGPGAVAEAARVLQPGGALVCIEPDFGGMLEWPDEIALRDVWLRGLTAAGADPEIGRKLPGACESAGLDSWVELQNLPQPTTADAVRLCEGLPLSEADSARVDAAAAALADLLGAWSAFVHVPYVLVVAMKPW